MKCISTRLLVTIKEDEKTTNDLGLTLPSDLSLEGMEEAKAVFVGSEVKDDIQEGTGLYIYKGSGKDFTGPDGNKYRVITTTDIIAIL